MKAKREEGGWKMLFRRRSFRLVLPVCLFVSSAGSVAAAVQALETKTFSLPARGTVVIQNDYGRIRVNPWDREQAEVRVRRIAVSETALANVVVDVQQEGDRLEVQSIFRGTGGASVYLDIRVPASLNIVIWGSSPAVEVNGIRGYVRAYTRSGMVTATDLSSSVSLTTESGDVLYLSHVQPERDIRLESVLGNIVCKLVPGLNLRGWVRAGGTLSWNREVEFSAGYLEKQLGIGGPLLFASSLEGAVNVQLDLDPSSQQALREVETASAGSASRSNAGGSGDSEPRRKDRAAPVLGDPEVPGRDNRTDVEGRAEEKAASGGGETGGYSLKVNVNWIYLNLSVRDRRTNRSVADLRKEDFLVYEDGLEQTVEEFLPSETPFHLLLLLDTSGSTRDFIDLIQEASIEFTHQIKDNDQIAVAAFNTRPRLIQPFTNDRSEIARSIRRIRSNGGTAFYDALDRSIHEYMGGIEGRKAIVVFTDGVDNKLDRTGPGSSMDFPELFRSIQEIDTMIYTIFLDTEEGSPMQRVPPVSGGGSVIDILGDIIRGQTMGRRGPMSDAEAYMEARRQLKAIADQTGGRMYAPRQIYDLSNTYQEIADDLRVQYTLAYNSSNTDNQGQWREIDVRIRDRRDLAVRTRKGYYAPSP